MLGITSKRPGGVEHGVDFAHHHFRQGKTYEPAGYGIERARTPNPIWIPQPSYVTLGGIGESEPGMGRGIGRIALVVLGAVLINEVFFK